jgi:hypothetical protein
MPFYGGKRSAGICVVLGPKKSSTYFSEYASGFFEPAASHLPAPPLPRNEGLLGQTPIPLKTSVSFVLSRDRRCDVPQRGTPHSASLPTALLSECFERASTAITLIHLDSWHP